eukprot:CAMPEP_0179090228 /NCGR_PEP_ID=MMETSP0796-20121207/41153_1 /TAXON_ID=73915 /ORGANISM="Pyrodinium bahamense, Strain pbaha01" /LENGTH=104 /DNA_ID=CAMNT_0020787795 /DNA_START=493 /DNA_END=807 /DNA_ORIENTATION=-
MTTPLSPIIAPGDGCACPADDEAPAARCLAGTGAVGRAGRNCPVPRTVSSSVSSAASPYSSDLGQCWGRKPYIRNLLGRATRIAGPEVAPRTLTNKPGVCVSLA